MNSKKITWIAFAVLVLLQFWVPVSVIMKKENILSTGTAFKFRTAPVDPNDYLRGKYVYLNFNENSFPVKDGKDWHDGQEVFVDIGTDSAGFAMITRVSKKAADAGKDHIKTTVNYISYGSNTQKEIFVEWPFERFYMEESKAPLAEVAYNEVRVDSSIISYALVKVKKGHAVLENVYIDNKPIDEYIKK